MGEVVISLAQELGFIKDDNDASQISSDFVDGIVAMNEKVNSVKTVKVAKITNPDKVLLDVIRSKAKPKEEIKPVQNTKQTKSNKINLDTLFKITDKNHSAVPQK